MKLTDNDKGLLRKWGHCECDFPQIEVATHGSKTRYELGGTLIGRNEAIRLLGREGYLSGISRSAFHGSALRTTDSGEEIYFDSYCLFK